MALPHPDDTDRLGALLAKSILAHAAAIAESGLNIRLEGNLGAGKTALTRALLRASGYAGPVKSPTFSLLESYPIDTLTLNHFDFYRFEDPMEFEDAGFSENFGAGQICMTEWTNKAEPYIPSEDILIELEHDGLGRLAHLSAGSQLGQTILNNLEH